MTREDTKKCIEVMQAYVDGKKIECRYADNDIFNPSPDPIWNWDFYEYRVKPEPKVRPYANAEECFADIKKHGEWINVTGDYMIITGVSKTGFRVYNTWYKFEDITEICVWADDGSPCGVVEE